MPMKGIVALLLAGALLVPLFGCRKKQEGQSMGREREMQRRAYEGSPAVPPAEPNAPAQNAPAETSGEATQ